MSPKTRVAVDGLSDGAAEYTLSGPAHRYVTRVRRLGPGDELLVFDPARGLEGVAEILGSDPHELSYRVRSLTPAAPPSLLPVTLIQCLGKGEKPDEVVRAATALGVGTIKFAESERAVVHLDQTRAGRRTERWRAIALDAARQSGRATLPAIAAPVPLGELFAWAETISALRLLMDPEAETPLAELVKTPPSALVVVIGPEGGLGDAELAEADRRGFTRARLGRLVLRTELASTAVLGALVALFDRSG